MPYERIDGCFRKGPRGPTGSGGDDHQEPEEDPQNDEIWERQANARPSTAPTNAAHGNRTGPRRRAMHRVQPCVDETATGTTSIIRPRLVPMARRDGNPPN